MRAKQFIKQSNKEAELNEAPYGFGQDWNYGDDISSEVGDVIPELPADFNKTVALRKIMLLKKELGRDGLNRTARAKIVAEIRKLENMISLSIAQVQSQPGYGRTELTPMDDGGPYTMYTELNQAGQPVARTIKGARNVGQQAVMQQKANTYIIITNNKHEIVFVWYPQDRKQEYAVGNTYRPPKPTNGQWTNLDADSPRYPAGHPHAGAVMPPKV